MEIKMCVYCEHCEHEDGIDYGGQTGYQEGSYHCSKRHFSYEPEELDGWALRAMDCPDYELSAAVKKELKERGYNDAKI